MSKENLDLVEVLEQQKAQFTKIKDRFEQKDFDPTVEKLLKFLKSIQDDDELLVKLQEEMNKHYGE